MPRRGESPQQVSLSPCPRKTAVLARRTETALAEPKPVVDECMNDAR